MACEKEQVMGAVADQVLKSPLIQPALVQKILNSVFTPNTPVLSGVCPFELVN